MMIAAHLLTCASGLALAAQAAPATTQVPPQAKPAPQRSNDVVVTGTRSDVIGSTDRTSFSVANDLAVQNGTLADALRAVPGVDVDLQGNVSLRGDPGVTILIDGRPSAMLRGESRGDALQSMPAGQIDRVEIITNPSAAMSPEGSGGVINLVTKRVRPNTRSATLKAAAGPLGRAQLTANGALSGKTLTLTGDAAYRRFRGSADSTLDRVRVNPANGTTTTTTQVSDVTARAQMQSARIGADYSISAKSKLSGELSYREGRQDISSFTDSNSQLASNSFDRDAFQAMRMRSLGGRTSWRRTLPGRGHELTADVNVEAIRQRRSIDAQTVFATAAPSRELISTDLDRSAVDAQVDYKRPLGKDGSLNLGYEGDFNGAQFDFRGVRGASLDALAPVPSLTNQFDWDQAVHAFYATYQVDPGKFEAQLGLRAEQAEIDLDQRTDRITFERDYFRLYPTAHFGYELSATEQLRGSYSRRIQRPNGQDLNPYTIYLDPLNLRRGNPNLMPEVTDSFEAGWQKRKGGTFYSVTGFYRTSRGGVTDVVQDLGNGVFLNTRANLATAERVGVELVASGRLSKTLTYNASGSYLWNRIDPRQAGISTSRSGATGSVRGSLTWQPSAKDFFQLSGNFTGEQLIPQGYRAPGGLLNAGYRRKLNDKISLTLTGQNILDTQRTITVLDTPLIRDRIRQKGPGAIVLAGINWTIGGTNARKRPEPAFDFDQGAGAN
ncbi:TonB-dependent receptor domain-containing protein [Sphingomonas floccifaciens]|uniref:TonB-dependent receptor domain-containing protein n=1 Tax=Sphingomonas floccifaciens TaxID=1844115 RepID=A0ABW4N9M4_9SPHN